MQNASNSAAPCKKEGLWQVTQGRRKLVVYLLVLVFVYSVCAGVQQQLSAVRDSEAEKSFWVMAGLDFK